jgi:hypothetical protein
VLWLTVTAVVDCTMQIAKEEKKRRERERERERKRQELWFGRRLMLVRRTADGSFMLALSCRCQEEECLVKANKRDETERGTYLQ